MDGIWDQVQTFFWNIIHRPTWIDYVDILIIAFLIYQLIRLIRKNNSVRVARGIVLILVMLTTNNPILKGYFAGLRQKFGKHEEKGVSEA